MTVIFVSTGVSTGLMVDKMMKVAPGGLVVPLLPKKKQLQVQNPRWDVGFGVFIALRDKKKTRKYRCGYEGDPKNIFTYKPGFFLTTPQKSHFCTKNTKYRYDFMAKRGLGCP